MNVNPAVLRARIAYRLVVEELLVKHPISKSWVDSRPVSWYGDSRWRSDSSTLRKGVNHRRSSRKGRRTTGAFPPD